jgi:hypothetical protein
MENERYKERTRARCSGEQNPKSRNLNYPKGFRRRFVKKAERVRNKDHFSEWRTGLGRRLKRF